MENQICEADNISICSSGYPDGTAGHDTHEMEDSGKGGFREIEVLCFVGEAAKNEELKTGVREKLGIAVEESEKGDDFPELSEGGFVLADFSTPEFRYIQAREQRIFGPTIVAEHVKTGFHIPRKKKHRPIYCSSMKDVVICMTGVRNKKAITELVDMVHWMGGSVRKEFTRSVTHVIGATTQSEKYRHAVALGKPVMAVSWVEEAWKKREEAMSSALSPPLVAAHKLPPFYGLSLSFVGVEEKDMEDICEQLVKNGGKYIPFGPETTHIVMPSDHNYEKSDEHTCHAVTLEWFWTSVQLDICARESLYAPYADGQRRSKKIVSPPQRHTRKSLRRTLETRSSLGADFGGDASSDLSGLMPAEVFSHEESGLQLGPPSPKKEMSKRQQVCMELLQTEKNFVDILRTIVTQYKEPLEQRLLKHEGRHERKREEKDNGHRLSAGAESLAPESPQHSNGHIDAPLIERTQFNQIFGKIQPILDVHEKIYKDLSALMSHWSEQWCVGTVWLRYASALEKCYPPFVNSFDSIKESLKECERSNDKFKAFLKLVKLKPESQRQGLGEILIRPVQRLPSVLLLLNDILKRSEEKSKAHKQLSRAIEEIKKVLLMINSKKNKVEECHWTLNVFNSIESFPTHLIASLRMLQGKLDVVLEKVDTSSSQEKMPLIEYKGRPLTLFLFNDFLEIAKCRHVDNEEMAQTPTGKYTIPTHKGKKQPHKHVQPVLPYEIRAIRDIPEGSGLFILTIRSELEDVNCVFQVSGQDPDVGKDWIIKELGDLVLRDSGKSVLEEYSLVNERSKENNDYLFQAVNKVVSRGPSMNSKTGRRMSLSRNISFGSTQSLAGNSGRMKRAVSHATMSTFRTLRRAGASALRLTSASIAEEPVSATASPEEKVMRPSTRTPIQEVDWKKPAQVRPPTKTHPKPKTASVR